MKKKYFTKKMKETIEEILLEFYSRAVIEGRLGMAGKGAFDKANSEIKYFINKWIR